MKKVFISCPPMLAEQQQIEQLAREHGLEPTCANVVQTLSEAELSKVLPEHDAWIAGDDPGTRAVLQAGHAGRLRTVVKWGVGVDNIDREAAAELGLAFANTPGMFNHEVADLAYGYLINLVRQVGIIDTGVRNNQWLKPQGISLSGKTAGVVGLGNIGQEIVRRLRTSKMEVIGYDPYAKESEQYTLASWPDQVGQCDVIVLCCALTDDNRHLINATSIAAMKRGVYLVNVSRGPLIDEPALIEAMNSGQIAGAALDVFEEEPPTPSNPLLAFERCIFGSHNASNTIDAVRATNSKAMQLVAELL